MKMRNLIQLLVALVLLGSAAMVHAVDFVSVVEDSAILYDAPSLQAEKMFVVSKYTPLEQVVTLDNWIKVRDRSGMLYWVEKRALSDKRYLVALPDMLDVYTRPDSEAPLAFRVRRNVVLERIESTGTGWVEVRHQDGDTGYVRSDEVWGE